MTSPIVLNRTYIKTKNIYEDGNPFPVNIQFSDMNFILLESLNSPPNIITGFSPIPSPENPNPLAISRHSRL